ncbi:MAG: hypothetical protein OK457_06535 [Thaumarchaeota archaeon]|nr:hypothetical protein [Nitrososphaerota archaeon]
MRTDQIKSTPVISDLESETAEIYNFIKSIQEDILRGIDNGLDAFGDNVRTVFYSEMEKYYQFDRNKILEHSEEFVKAISRFFTVGSSLVERSIGREILKVFDIPLCPSLNYFSALEIVKRYPSLSQFRNSGPKIEN